MLSIGLWFFIWPLVLHLAFYFWSLYFSWPPIGLWSFIWPLVLNLVISIVKQIVGISVFLSIGLCSFIWPPIFGVCFHYDTMIILSMLYQMLGLCQLHLWLPQNDTKWLNDIIKSFINTIVFQLIIHFELLFGLFIFPFTLRDSSETWQAMSLSCWQCTREASCYSGSSFIYSTPFPFFIHRTWCSWISIMQQTNYQRIPSYHLFKKLMIYMWDEVGLILGDWQEEHLQC